MRRATVLAAAVLALGTLGAPAMAVAPGDVPDEGAAATSRISGETRYDTAAQTALQAYPDGADTVIVATGEIFPDALAASYLSGAADVDAPILLTRRDEIPSFTMDAMEQLDPSNVVVLGGTDAISGPVVGQLRDIVGDDNVEVIGGGTRRETAAMIARAGGDVGTMPNLGDSDSDTELRTAIVARADAFPDALASGPLALAGRHPILLTDTDDLPQATIDALTDEDLGIEQVVITGGTVAVSEDVRAEIADLDGIANVTRVSGSIRTETAVRLGELTRSSLGWDGSDVALARGDNFPDALSLAPLAAQMESSLFLSRNPQTIEGDTFAGIQALCGSVEDLLISGGSVAISADAAGEAKLATICADHAFPISNEQEVADVEQAASGTGWVVVEGDTVCTTYDVDGLEGEADASHIHNAVAGSDGDVVMDLGAPNAEGFLATCGVDADVAAGISAEPAAYYVNVHTPEYPLGVARGQLDGNQAMRVDLTGAAEVQEDGEFVDEPAEGQGTLDLFPGDGELCYELTVSGLASPVDPTIAGGFHIHQGAVDANGDVVLPLPQAQSATDYTAFDCVAADQELLDGITENPQDHYANLHTVEPGDPDTPLNGALRGQLGADAELMVFGDAEVDDSTPADPVFGQGVDGLVGDATLTLGADAGTVCLDLSFRGGLDGDTIADPDDGGPVDGGVHIHTGQVDQNGPIVVAFPGLEGTEGGRVCSDGNAGIDAILASGATHYLNVHTESSPAGAARGQLAADVTTELTGAAEVGEDAGDLTATGTANAHMASLANPDVVCGSFDVEGADPLTAAHIHQAPAGENGDVVVTLGDYGDAGVEAPGADITAAFGCQTDVAEDVASAVFGSPGDHYVNVHSETFPNGAVRGQLG
jgi:putative cell wall-binding protein